MDYKDHTICYYKSAVDLFIPVTIHPQIEAFELSFGRKKYFFSKAFTPFNSATSSLIFQNKLYASFLLSKHNIPIPRTGYIHRDDYIEGNLEDILGSLAFPLVIKSLEANGFEEVAFNIKSMAALKKHLDNYLPVYESFLIQEVHDNLNSYRILVFKNQIISVIQYIVADDVGEEPYFKAINTKICNKNKKLILRVAKLTALNFMEINLTCEDINIPIDNSKGFITEINENPNIKIHEVLTDGKLNRVSLKMIRSLIYQNPMVYLLGFLHRE